MDYREIMRQIMTQPTVPLWPQAGRPSGSGEAALLKALGQGKSKRSRLGGASQSPRRGCERSFASISRAMTVRRHERLAIHNRSGMKN
jgi:hypothetical protein